MEFSKSRARFRNWALGASESAGGYNAPGLPEIEGTFNPWGIMPYSANSGAFVSRENNGTHPNASNGGGGVLFTFQASGSNSIYGASSTVMPPSVNTPVILYLGRAAQI